MHCSLYIKVKGTPRDSPKKYFQSSEEGMIQLRNQLNRESECDLRWMYQGIIGTCLFEQVCWEKKKVGKISGLWVIGIKTLFKSRL